MNKSEFVSKLQDNLQSIPSEERESALKYYRDYFDDAGVENEQKVIAELESPEVIAKGIRDDLGYAQESAKAPVPPVDPVSPGPDPAPGTSAGPDLVKNAKSFVTEDVQIGRHRFPTWGIIVIAILFIPVIVPVASGIFGTLLGLFFGLFGMVLGFLAAALALLVAGIAAVAWGIGAIIVGAVFNGILLIGAGLVLFGFGLLFLVLSIQFIFVWIPMFIRWIARVIRSASTRPSVKKGEFA